jgi:hypothetical protein
LVQSQSPTRPRPSPSRDAVRVLLREDDRTDGNDGDGDGDGDINDDDRGSGFGPLGRGDREPEQAPRATEALMQLLQHSHIDPYLLDVTGFESPIDTSGQQHSEGPNACIVTDTNAHELQYLLTQKISGKNNHSPSARAVLPAQPTRPRHPAFLPLYSVVHSSQAFLLVSPYWPLTLESAIKHSHRGLLLDDAVYVADAVSTSELVGVARTKSSGGRKVGRMFCFVCCSRF